MTSDTLLLTNALQPIYSAFRSAAYGSGLLEIVDANTATWSWTGFLKQVSWSSLLHITCYW